MIDFTADFIALLRNTTNSYKYLFLKSVLARTQQNQERISVNDIVADQLVYAWYPNQYFKLSFGLQDKISQVFKEQNFNYSSNIPITSNDFEHQLRAEILTHVDTVALSRLSVYVQFRLISPFFDQELRGKPDHVKNNMIAELSNQTYDIRKPLYRIETDKQFIQVHPEWGKFIRRHYHLLAAYLESEWVKYLQKHNPNIPGVISKTAPPINRSSLKSQTSYWTDYLIEHPRTLCIYSGDSLDNASISIDHFLPWSFVCHDRIWNLVPTTKSINSSKGNALPSMDKYLDKFIETQFSALSYHNKKCKDWDKISFEVMHDLGLSDTKQLLNDVAFEKHISQVLVG
ncbi:HNH endonuclease domain-containing protein [Alteromonas sp. W364]|uniref:HNH endonuclease domain-containing protein n=1 Tax=Alteromonas sp. W364 TaxID=3075610 RepID=UPI002888D8DD|nr:HNH endonuclease domain-containing protein [Alteromonas sp. W364]MDT0628069.1 HNH endonuclease domain-containing protein [Alteromonas sp. W364]